MDQAALRLLGALEEKSDNICRADPMQFSFNLVCALQEIQQNKIKAISGCEGLHV